MCTHAPCVFVNVALTRKTHEETLGNLFELDQCVAFTVRQNADLVA